MNFRTFDLNLLRVFDEIMAERNLTRAAQNLSMTQPAVSNALKRLRAALADDIVVRAGHGVQPTPAAELWWPAVREALSQLRHIFAPPHFDPANSTDSFTVAMADATASMLVPAMVDVMQREAPGVTLRVQPLTTRDPRTLLETSGVDAAAGFFPVATAAIDAVEGTETTPLRFAYQSLYSSDYVCLMRRGHPLSAPGALTLDAYCGAAHLLVSLSGRPHGLIDEALAALGRRRRTVLIVNQLFTAGMVVVNSDLLTVVPAHFICSTGMPGALLAVPLPFVMPRVHLAAMWLRTREQRNGHAWLLQTIERAAALGTAKRRTQDAATSG